MRYFFLTIFSLTFIGCQLLQPAPAPDAGFIPNPEKQKPHPERAPFQKVWFADKSEFAKLKETNKGVYIKPVDTTHLLSSSSWQKIASLGTSQDAEDVKAIASELRTAFIEKLEAHSGTMIDVVETPGTNTFVLELSLVELNPTKVAINAAGTVAGAVVPGGGLISVTGKGSIAFEAILRDHETGKVLLTFGDRRTDKMTLISVRSYTPYGFARLTIQDWADQYAELSNTKLDHKVEGASGIRLLPW
jgi:hypothetical protein